jgi:protein-tyrosine phosphatase
MGEFGPEAQATAIDWLQRGWVHVMATDAHNVTKRQPRFRAARERVAELVGEEIARCLFVDNPKSVVESRGLVYDPDLPDSSVHESGSVLNRLRRLFTK